jgi:uridine phosphorylase
MLSALELALESGYPPVERLDPLAERAHLVSGRETHVLDRLHEPGRDRRGRLASVAAAPRYLVEHVLGAPARVGAGATRRGQRALDRRSQGLGKTPLAGGSGLFHAVSLFGRARRGCLCFAAVPTLLRPTGPVAPDALLPGDPARAMALAQHLLEAPRMSNHGHGLWGYHGKTAEGMALTVQATGVGGPSAAMVLADLAELGTTRAVCVGPCVSLGGDDRVGDLLVADRVLAADGTSAALGAGRWEEPDPDLFAALTSVAGPAARPASVASVDLVWDPAAERPSATRRARESVSEGTVAADMQAATLLAIGGRRDVAVACLLVVSDVDAGPSSRSEGERLGAASARAGEIGALALREAGEAARQESGSETVSRS